ncbi:hypothetical protein GCM10023063_19650 [Arthrobacter methylotrophus]|uniref:Uncharacterized protein n=1 Tax=Arthrobacter methylotrophus TaxID=121291 RepID=A0ABV5UPC3_9MICC
MGRPPRSSGTRTSAGSFYYTTGALGSIVLLTDSTQATTNPWTYAGGYNDTA